MFKFKKKTKSETTEEYADRLNNELENTEQAEVKDKVIPLKKSNKGRNTPTLRATLEGSSEKRLRRTLASWLYSRYGLLLSEDKLTELVANFKENVPVTVGKWDDARQAYLTLKEEVHRSDHESHYLYFGILEHTPTTEWAMAPLIEDEDINNFDLESHQMNVIRQMLREELMGIPPVNEDITVAHYLEPIEIEVMEVENPGYTIEISEDGQTATVTSLTNPPVINVIPVGSLNLPVQTSDNTSEALEPIEVVKEEI